MSLSFRSPTPPVASQAEGKTGLRVDTMRLVHRGRVLDDLDATLKGVCEGHPGAVHVRVDVHPVQGLWTTEGPWGRPGVALLRCSALPCNALTVSCGCVCVPAPLRR